MSIESRQIDPELIAEGYIENLERGMRGGGGGKKRKKEVGPKTRKAQAEAMVEQGQENRMKSQLKVLLAEVDYDKLEKDPLKLEAYIEWLREMLAYLEDEKVFDEEIERLVEKAEVKSTIASVGAGGQNRQKNETAVSVRHSVSGIQAICENQRSQTQNKREAMMKFKDRIIAHLYGWRDLLKLCGNENLSEVIEEYR